MLSFKKVKENLALIPKTTIVRLALSAIIIHAGLCELL